MNAKTATNSVGNKVRFRSPGARASVGTLRQVFPEDRKAVIQTAGRNGGKTYEVPLNQAQGYSEPPRAPRKKPPDATGSALAGV